MVLSSLNMPGYNRMVRHFIYENVKGDIFLMVPTYHSLLVHWTRSTVIMSPIAI